MHSQCAGDGRVVVGANQLAHHELDNDDGRTNNDPRNHQHHNDSAEFASRDLVGGDGSREPQRMVAQRRRWPLQLRLVHGECFYRGRTFGCVVAQGHDHHTILPIESGVRAFRWDEARKNRDAYYSVWLYVPQGAKVTGNYWNVFQFKSRTTDGSRVDPLWAFYAVSDANGIYLHAGWGWGSTPLAGPHATDGVSGKWYEQANRVYLPQGRWTHLEAFLHESTGTDFSGRLTFWQDGQQLFDLQNVRTTFNNCNYNTWCADDEWSVNVVLGRHDAEPVQRVLR
jgi:hypothetical protein